MTLRQYRQIHRSGRRLAADAGIGLSYLNKITYGDVPTADVAARISAATGGVVSVEELLYPAGLPDGARVSRRGRIRAAS